MSKIVKEKITQYVDIPEQNVRIRVWKHGDIDICCHFVPKDVLDNIRKITGKKLKVYGSAKWITFARARDKSQVTLFEE